MDAQSASVCLVLVKKCSTCRKRSFLKFSENSYRVFCKKILSFAIVTKGISYLALISIHSGLMKKDIEWFAKADLSKYKGRYVAILDKKVIASGTNAKKVWEEARKKYPDRKSAIAKIPEDETFVLSVNSMNRTEKSY